MFRLRRIRFGSLTELCEQTANDLFDFQLFADPLFAEASQLVLACAQLGGCVFQGCAFAIEGGLPLLGGVTGLFAFALELGLAKLLGGLEFGQLSPLGRDCRANLLKILFQKPLRFGEPAFGVVEADLLRELGPDLFDGHSHFERVAVRVFQFDPQAVEPLAAAFQPFTVGGERLFAVLKFRLPSLPVNFPSGPVGRQRF